MALPSSYLTSVKNLKGILNAIQSAQAPDKFTHAFLSSLDFKSSSDRLIIGVLKSMSFLDDGGRPIDRYFRFLDQTQAERVLAEGIREAYADLFQVNVKAHTMSRQALINKFKTLSQGKISDSVLNKMALTFTNLVKLADFTGSPAEEEQAQEEVDPDVGPALPTESHAPMLRSLGGMVYNIQLVLPESRDPAVYDALFEALRKHLP